MRIIKCAMLAAGVAACATDPPTEPTGQTFPSFREARADTANLQWTRYIVRLNDDVTGSRFSDSVLASAGAHLIHRYRNLLSGFNARLPEQAVNGLRNNSKVMSVEEDQMGFPTVSLPLRAPTGSYALDRIDDRLGLDGDFSPLQDGSGVEIWIIDTGVDSAHVDFTNRIGASWATYAPPYDPFVDCTPHGTGVASAAAGTTYGVAKAATVYSIQIGDCNTTPLPGGAHTGDAIAALDFVRSWATPPAVANLSYNFSPSNSLDDATRNLYFAGIPLVTSAGNDTTDACNFSPNRIGSDVLVVGASNIADSRASFSNFGACVDLFAPGRLVPVAWPPAPNGSANVSGTSFAAPLVAGVMALIMDGNNITAPWTTRDIVVGSATANVLSNIGAGSPNRLLYSVHTWVIISGPHTLTSAGNYTWTAQGYGGNSTYTFSWEISFNEGTSWSTVGSGPNYTRFIDANHGDFWIRAKVTSMGEQVASREKVVRVLIECGGFFIC